MSKPKTPAELASMKEGGKRLGQILKTLLQEVKVGVTPMEIDTLAFSLIKEADGKPSFTTVKGYKWATCISVNDGVVHGIPNKTPFKVGDVVSIDVGMIYEGFHTDTSWTIYLPEQKDADSEILKFLEVGEEALRLALKAARAGNHVGHISQAIQATVEKSGYHVVRGLVGHAIGKNLHEHPQIPGILSRSVASTPKLVENMTFAVEVIYSMGSSKIVHTNDDGWTLGTSDGSIAGLFESTIAIGKNEPIVLTQA